MSEPVKVVIVIEDGQLRTVHSCGVPIRAVVIEYEDQGGDAIAVPTDDGGTAQGFAWEILVEAESAHALELFNLGAEP